MRMRGMGNVFLLLAFATAVGWSLPGELKVYLVIVIGVVAVMSNIRGLEASGIGIAAASLGILWRFFEPMGIVLLIFVLIFIGIGLRILVLRKGKSGDRLFSGKDRLG